MTDTRMQSLADNQSDKMEVEEKEEEEEEVVATVDTEPTPLDVVKPAPAPVDAVDTVSTPMDTMDTVSAPVDTMDTVSAPVDSVDTVSAPVDTVPAPVNAMDIVSSPAEIVNPAGDVPMEDEKPASAPEVIENHLPTPPDSVSSPVDVAMTPVPPPPVNNKQSHSVTQEISQEDQKSENRTSDNPEAMETVTSPSNETTTTPLSKETSIATIETSVPCNETSKQPHANSNLSTKTSISSFETCNPSPETSIPSNETSIPSNETSMPSNETSIPSNETSIPSNETSIPSNETCIPSNSVTHSDRIPSKVNEGKTITSDVPTNIPQSNQVSENKSDIRSESLNPGAASSDVTVSEGDKKSENSPTITENAQHVSENAQTVILENAQGITENSQDSITDSTETNHNDITQPAQDILVNKPESTEEAQETVEQSSEKSETADHDEIHNTSEDTMSATENEIAENLQEMSEECSANPVNQSSTSQAGEAVVVSQPVYSMVEGGEGDEVVSHNNVISIPEFTVEDDDDDHSAAAIADIKLEPRPSFTLPSSMTLPSQITLSSGSTLLINNQSSTNNILAAAMAGANVGGHDAPTTTTSSGSKNYVKIEPSALGMLKPPSTDALLKTAKEVLQLQDEPPQEYRRFITGSGNILVDSAGNIVQTNDQSLSICSDEVSGMEVSDENGTYILESVNGGEFYEDPNIMWIEETVEVEQESYDGLSPMVIILNPNGTVNEELMLANGMNMETIKAVTDAASGGLNLQTVLPSSTSTPQPVQSITSLQHPIPKRLLTGVQPVISTAPRSVIDAANETQRSVILDQKEDYLILDDIKDPMLTAENGIKPHQAQRIISIKGNQHVLTTSKPLPDLRKINSMNVQSLMHTPMNLTPLGTLDLSMPKKEPGDMLTYAQKQALDQFVNPSALVSEHTVLKVLDQSKQQRNSVTKMRRPRMRDENGNGGSPYIHRKTTSLGALGQALHGTPRDSRENAVQICPICKFQATTKNPYRHLQDHLARVHFKDRIAAELPTKKPYVCPFEGCDGKAYPDWQAVMRHYIGKKHGILDKYVKEELCQIRRENGGRIPGTIIRPGVELIM